MLENVVGHDRLSRSSRPFSPTGSNNAANQANMPTAYVLSAQPQWNVAGEDREDDQALEDEPHLLVPLRPEPNLARKVEKSNANADQNERADHDTKAGGIEDR